MRHILMMLIGCVPALLLIFLLPAMGLGSGWVMVMAFGAMFVCHLMHFGMHKGGIAWKIIPTELQNTALTASRSSAR